MHLLLFFRARKGKAIGFRFKDWTDFKATAQNLGTGDGSRTQFQLIKRYSNGGAEEQRIIAKPVSGSVSVYKDGVLQSSGVTVNHTTGLIVFSSAPANGVVVTATYEFDVPVRFDTDRLAASLGAYGANSWQDIALIEVRV